MTQYLLYCSSDCRSYGLFRSLKDSKVRANEIYKNSSSDFSRRFWVIDVLMNRSFVCSYFYKCPDA